MVKALEVVFVGGSGPEHFRHFVCRKMADVAWTKIKSQNKYFSVSDLLLKKEGSSLFAKA